MAQIRPKTAETNFKPVNILILNHNHERFGTYFRCKFIAEELTKHGHRVTMICASGKNFDLKIRHHKSSASFSIITLPRIKYSQYFTGQILRLLFTLPYIFFADYDVAYAFTVAQPQIAIPAILSKKILKRPLIIDWDDLWGGGFAQAHHSFVAKILTFFESHTPKYADHLTYASRFLGNEIKRLGLNIPMTYVPNGAHPKDQKQSSKKNSRKQTKLPLDKKLILSLGNTYTDSLRLMLKAFSKAISQNPNLNLVFVGNLVIPEKFQTLFNRFKSNITVVGTVPYQQVHLYLSAADSLILPMDNSPIEKARFPMRFGEYLTSGRPLISNAVGDVRYFIKKYQCGYLTKPDDYVGLGKAMMASVKPTERNRKYSSNSLKLAKTELNWATIGEKVNTIITKYA